MLACSTAAGPALEGANIRFGMRGQKGVIDHVWMEEKQLKFSVIGNGSAKGICGSGLIDAIAVFLENGWINKRGRIQGNEEIDGQRVIQISETVYLTQNDIREVQLAKGAIAAGIHMLMLTMHLSLEQIDHVILAGAFGTYMNSESACRIGMIPSECKSILECVLELGKELGFEEAVSMDTTLLKPMEMVRGSCEADRCHAYGKNWTCPPACGTLEECSSRLKKYPYGVLVQTVGILKKEIDTKAYRETEKNTLKDLPCWQRK